MPELPFTRFLIHIFVLNLAVRLKISINRPSISPDNVALTRIGAFQIEADHPIFNLAFRYGGMPNEFLGEDGSDSAYSLHNKRWRMFHV